MKQEKLIRHNDREAFEKTRKEFVQLELVKPEDELRLWESKAGGNPYLPKDTQYPLNQAGEPLHLLAQLNLGQLPKLPDFPDKGILSFYIDLNDVVFGMNFDQQDDQSGFRVLFFADVEENEENLVTDFSAIDEHRSNCEFEVLEGGEFMIKGKASSMYIAAGITGLMKLSGNQALIILKGWQKKKCQKDMKRLTTSIMTTAILREKSTIRWEAILILHRWIRGMAGADMIPSCSSWTAIMTRRVKNTRSYGAMLASAIFLSAKAT